jgi:hypothetical protein
MELKWSDFDFGIKIEIVRLFSLKWCANCSNPLKNKGMALFFVKTDETTLSIPKT